MEVEPLQDTLPDRYAIESDDSEDEIGRNIYPHEEDGHKTRKKITYNTEFVWTEGGGELSGKRTYVAVGQAGLFWAAGIKVGQKAANIHVKDEPVARVHSLDSDGVLVLLQYDLPIAAMSTFASRVLTTLRPSSLVLIDGYSSPAYITASPPQDAPIRYLSTRTFASPPKTISRFKPPNLLLSPSAAFMNAIETEGKREGLLLLLPLPHIERPPPRDLQPTEIKVSWPEALMKRLQDVVLPKVHWDAELAKEVGRVIVSKKRPRIKDDVGMSMYI